MTPAERTKRFHPELATAALWLPRGFVREWSLWFLARAKPPTLPLPRGMTLAERLLPGGHASVRIVREIEGAQRRPVVMWLHGGGYVLGDARQDDRVCARLAKRLGAVVASVNYRLAPRHPFPAALDDCIAAWEILHRDADALGVDPTRSILAGQSAGAGLAAGLSHRLLDEGRPLPRLQMLAYPMLDDRTVLREIDGRHHRVWDRASNEIGWAHYLGSAPGTADVSDHAAPSRRSDLRGLPPTWIGVGSHDLFHDENVDYAQRLAAAGVPVELVVVPDAFHAFDLLMPHAAVSRAFVESQTQAMERALADVP